MKTHLALGLLTTAAALAAPGIAFAQAADTPRSQDAAGIEDIIVTAERQANTVQKSSVVLQVVQADELIRAGVTEPKDLGRLVPGMQVGTAVGGSFIFIRGIGDASASQTTNPGVAFNLDGVNLGRPDANALVFYDLERVEVLKGPQGTLYGRNAVGGAVNVITRRPDLAGTSGYATFELGNYGLQHLTTAVNLPVSATFALRAALDVVDRSGYLSNGTDDDVHQAGRISALLQPSAALSVLTTFDYARQRGKGSGSVIFPRPPGTTKFLASTDPQAIAFIATQPPFGPAMAYGTPAIGASGLSASLTTPPMQQLEVWGISSEINYDLGGVTLTLLPAYRKMQVVTNAYMAWQDRHDSNARQFSTEFRLAGRTGPAEWIAGLYYFDEKVRSNVRIDRGNQVTSQTVDVNDQKSYAAFAQTTLHIGDAFRLLGGLRYTRDERQLRGSATSQVLAGPPPGFPVVIPNIFAGEVKFEEVTWRGGAEYDVGPGNMFYATVSKGYKSGGLNSEPPPNSYAPEYLTAYQIGLRNRFLDNRLQVNVELFKWDYKNHQEGGVALDNTGLPNFLVTNAGTATLKGFNIDVVAKPGHHDTLHAMLEYNDARYDSFKMTQPFFGQPPVTGCRVSAPTVPAPGQIPTVDLDCAGFQLARTPKWAFSAGWEHVFPLANGGEVTASGGIEYVGARWGSIDFVPVTRFPSYVTGDASLSYAAAGGKWSITGFVRNIANEIIPTSTYLGAQPSVAIQSVNAPRTYGARLTVNF